MLYRGLGGVRLPERFYHADKCGHRAFVEWGFMSTTADRAIAVQYTGIAQGRAFPTLLMIQPAAVDHGGDIGKFSQLPTTPPHQRPILKLLNRLVRRRILTVPW